MRSSDAPPAGEGSPGHSVYAAYAADSMPLAPAARVTATPSAGLSGAEVDERRSRGLTNADGERTSRSVAHILRANILTRFNLILGVLLAVILAVGQPQDGS